MIKLRRCKLLVGYLRAARSAAYPYAAWTARQGPFSPGVLRML